MNGMANSYELDRESSSSFDEIEKALRQQFKDVNLQYPPEVVKYEFGIDPYTDDKGKKHPFEPPRPCIRFGLLRTCSMIGDGKLKTSDLDNTTSVIANNMLRESREWVAINWPDRDEAQKMITKFRISPVSQSGDMATDPKKQRELTREAAERAVTQFRPEEKK